MIIHSTVPPLGADGGNAPNKVSVKFGEFGLYGLVGFPDGAPPDFGDFFGVNPKPAPCESFDLSTPPTSPGAKAVNC